MGDLKLSKEQEQPLEWTDAQKDLDNKPCKENSPICAKCGHTVKYANAKYCTRCGHKLDT